MFIFCAAKKRTKKALAPTPDTRLPSSLLCGATRSPFRIRSIQLNSFIFLEEGIERSLLLDSAQKAYGQSGIWRGTDLRLRIKCRGVRPVEYRTNSQPGFGASGKTDWVKGDTPESSSPLRFMPSSRIWKNEAEWSERGTGSGQRRCSGF